MKFPVGPSVSLEKIPEASEEDESGTDHQTQEDCRLTAVISETRSGLGKHFKVDLRNDKQPLSG